MIPILIEGPAIEPVTAAEMRAYLRLDGADEDDLVVTLATAARLMTEAASGRLLITQTWRLVLDAWPAGGLVRVPLAPFAGLLAARVFDAAGAPVSVPPSAFIVDTLGEPGRVQRGPDVPDPGRALNGIELDLRAGYGALASDVPMPLRQAIRLLTAHWFDNRGDGPPIGEPPLPAGFAALLAPYRRARL